MLSGCRKLFNNTCCPDLVVRMNKIKWYIREFDHIILVDIGK